MYSTLRTVLYGIFFFCSIVGTAMAAPDPEPLNPDENAFAPCSTLVLQFNVLSPVTCAGSSTGTVQLSAMGGNPPYSFNWANGDTSKTRSNLPAGTYVAVVTDNMGCVYLDSVTLIDPPTLIPAGVVTSSVTCFGGTDGVIQIQGTGGTPPYSYVWANGDTNAIRSNLPAGGYFVTVIDANGCTASQTITLPAPSQLILDFIVTDSITCVGGSDGVLTMQGVGGTGPYSYTWGNGDTSASRSALPAGSYFGTVTDANGCTVSNTFVLNDPAPFSITGTVVQPISCAGGSDGAIQVQGAGGQAPYTYFWGNGDTSSTRTNLPAGSYFVTVTDNLGCTSSQSVSISDPPAFSATLSVLTPVGCGGGNTGSIQITGVGGVPPYSYFWPNGDTNAVRSSLPAGTYFGTVTDSLGCTASNSVTLSPIGGLGLQFSVVSPITCTGAANGSLSVAPLSGVGPYTYLWSTGDTSATIASLSPGIYTVTVADSTGCSSTDSLTLSDPTPVQVQASVVQNLGCDGLPIGELTATVSGGTPGYSFSWSNGVTTAANPGLGAGTYIITITDTYGCSDADTLTLVVPDPLTLMTTLTQPVSCFGDSNAIVSLAGAGGVAPYGFMWEDGDQSAIRSGLKAGTYVIAVTDADGCMGSDTLEISQPTLVLADVVINTPVSCFGATDGILVASASGGTPPYSYLWDDGSTNSIRSGVGASLAMVTVTDDQGCEEMAEVTLTEPDSMFTVSQVSPDASCDSLNPDGALLVSTSGGTAPYTYVLSMGMEELTTTDGIFNGLQDGIWSLLVTDVNDCEVTVSIEVADSCESVSGLEAQLFDQLQVYVHEDVLVLEGMMLVPVSGSVSVYNVLGAEMVETEFPASAQLSWSQQTIHWPRGVYVVKVSTVHGAFFRKVRVQ